MPKMNSIIGSCFSLSLLPLLLVVWGVMLSNDAATHAVIITDADARPTVAENAVPVPVIKAGHYFELQLLGSRLVDDYVQLIRVANNSTSTEKKKDQKTTTTSGDHLPAWLSFNHTSNIAYGIAPPLTTPTTFQLISSSSPSSSSSTAASLKFTVLPNTTTSDVTDQVCADKSSNSEKWPLSMHIIFDLPAKAGALPLTARIQLMKRLAQYVDISSVEQELTWSAEREPRMAHELTGEPRIVVGDRGNVARVRQHNKPAVRLSWSIGCDLFSANNKELIRFVQEAARDGLMSKFLGRVALKVNATAKIDANVATWYIESAKPISRLKRQIATKDFERALAPNNEFFNQGGFEAGRGSGDFANDMITTSGDGTDAGSSQYSEHEMPLDATATTPRVTAPPAPTTTGTSTTISTTTTMQSTPAKRQPPLPPSTQSKEDPSTSTTWFGRKQQETWAPSSSSASTAGSDAPTTLTASTRASSSFVPVGGAAAPPQLYPSPSMSSSSTIRPMELASHSTYIGRLFEIEIEKLQIVADDATASSGSNKPLKYFVYAVSDNHSGNSNDIGTTWIAADPPSPLLPEQQLMMVRLSGLPLVRDAGINRLMIEAREKDTNKLVGRARLDINVVSWSETNKSPMSVLSVLPSVSCYEFTNNSKLQQQFIMKAASYLKMPAQDVVITSVGCGSTHVEWTLATLEQAKCPVEQIRELRAALQKEDFKTFMSPEFNLEKTVVTDAGKCDMLAVEGAEPSLQRGEPHDSDHDSEGSASDMLLVILVPAAIVSLIVLVAICVAIFMYRRNKRGKASYSTSGYSTASNGTNGGIMSANISDRTSFSKKTMQPIIFPEEISDPKSSSSTGDGSSFGVGSTPTPPGHRPTTTPMTDNSTLTTHTTNNNSRTPGGSSGGDRSSTSPRPLLKNNDNYLRGNSPPRGNYINGRQNIINSNGVVGGQQPLPQSYIVGTPLRTEFISASEVVTTTNNGGTGNHHFNNNHHQLHDNMLGHEHVPLLLKPQLQQPSTLRQTPSASPP